MQSKWSDADARKFVSDYGIATSGYAGPEGDPVGKVFVAVAGPKETAVQPYNWPGNRAEVQSRTAKMAFPA